MSSSPVPDPTPCPVCGNPVDKLRAGAMGIYGDTIRYFCGPECKTQFGVASFPPPAPVPRSQEPARAAEPTVVAAPAPWVAPAPISLPVDARRAPSNTSSGGVGHPASDEATGAGARRGPRRLVLAFVLAAVAAAAPLVLPGSLAATAVQGVCVVLLWAHLASIVASAQSRSDRLEELVPLLAAVLTGAAGVSALVTQGPAAAGMPLAFAAAVGAIATLGRALETRFAARAEAQMRAMLGALPRSALIVRPEGETETDLERVRAGEEVLVPAGEYVPVDGTIRSGEATIVPLPFGTHEERMRAGDLVVAGARVVRGEIRLVATFVGAERTLARIARLGKEGEVRPAPLVRGAVLAGRISTLVGLSGAVVVGTLQVWMGHRPLSVAFSTAAALILALSGRALGRIGASPLAACIGRAAAAGAFFRDAAAIETAARVATVVLSARGTVTEGISTVTEVEGIGDRDVNELLGLAAATSAAAAPDHPVTVGLMAAAAERSIPLPEVRRPAYQAGRGVLGAAPGGEALVVGSRQLLLSESVSIAAADDVVGRLEERGRTAILVAAAGKVQAVIGLSDKVRAEAPDAVAALARLGIEPVLLTGQSRTTAEALGRSLAVDHVRAEVEPDERAAEVRRLTESGTTVAVIGHPARDGAALDSADVAIALRWAGAPQGEPAVRLAGGRVLDAVLAIEEARHALRGISKNLTIASCALVLGTILAIGGLLPPPGAALLSALAAAAVARPSPR